MNYISIQINPMRYLLWLCILVACQSGPVPRVPVTEKKQGANPASIKILPLGRIRQPVVKELTDTLRTYIPALDLLPPEPMPRHAWYSPRQRYRADSLIHWMARRARRGEIWLGITEQDISTTKGSNPDYGVMGLGFHPGQAAVASSHRLRNKSHFYKVAIHELGHTLGLPHCPDESCYMRDAEGGDPTADEKYFCASCRQRLRQQGWKR